jgi:hypothetical protein
MAATILHCLLRFRVEMVDAKRLFIPVVMEILGLEGLQLFAVTEIVSIVPLDWMG